MARYTVILEGTGNGNIPRGKRFCLPGVTDAEFVKFPNGDAGLEFQNPKGDNVKENLRFVTIEEVKSGFKPGNLPQYHPEGPTDGKERRAR